MKKYLILLLLLWFSGCVHDDDDLFDRSAAVRIEQAMNRYDELLRSAPNGWIVEYYPEDGRSYGGFNLYFKFGDGGEVTVGSELSDNLATSLYSVKADMGPTLNFDTYNEVLHYFSDPGLSVGGGEGHGYEGDYEFVMMSGDESGIVLSGKKTRNTIRMFPLPVGTTWEEYRDRVRAQIAYIDALMATGAYAYTLEVGGTPVETDHRDRFLTFGSGESEVVAPYMYTPDGIQFYEPVEGVSSQAFALDAAGKRYVSASGDEVITLTIPPLNVIFAKTSELWQLDNPLSSDIVAAWKTTNDAIKKVWSAGSLHSAYLGWNIFSDYLGRSMIFVFTPGSKYYVAGYKCIFTAVAGTDDQVEIAYSTVPNRTFLYGDYMKVIFEPFVYTIAAHSPYVLTADDPDNPQSILLESVADPTTYFTLILY